MLNNFIIVGKINNIDYKEEKCVLTIKVPRNYKNENGEYDNDLIEVQVLDNLSNTLNEYCNVDDVIGIKGRIQKDNILFAEKISFLSSKE